jgi:hypothetical protein
MKKFPRYLLACVLISAVMLAGHAFYFNSLEIALADLLLWVCVVVCWGYLLKLAGSSELATYAAESVDTQLLHASHAFHVQLGRAVSNQLSSGHTEITNTQRY